MSAFRIIVAGAAILGAAVYLKRRQQKRRLEELNRKLAEMCEARAIQLAEHQAEMDRIRERGAQALERARRYVDALENHPKRGSIEAVEDACGVIRVDFTGRRHTN